MEDDYWYSLFGKPLFCQHINSIFKIIGNLSNTPSTDTDDNKLLLLTSWLGSELMYITTVYYVLALAIATYFLVEHALQPTNSVNVSRLFAKASYVWTNDNCMWWSTQ